MLARKMRLIGNFLNVALEDYRHVASLFPSSSHAARRVARQLEPGYRTIVEYGPGNGSITRELLARMVPDARLVAIEINRGFFPELEKIGDERLTLVHGDVGEIAPRLTKWFPDGVDMVVSGIPFSLTHPTLRDRILEGTREAIRPGGKCVVYQLLDTLGPSLRRQFAKVDTFHVLGNLPPYIVLVAKTDP